MDRESTLNTPFSIIVFLLKESKKTKYTMELWFAQYHICVLGRNIIKRPNCNSVLHPTEESRWYKGALGARKTKIASGCKFQVREYDSEIDIFNNLFNSSFQAYTTYSVMNNSSTDNSEEHIVAENTSRDQDLALLRQQLED